MASIKENRNKEGKITSFRVRACMGRDAIDNQVWRTTTIPYSAVEDEAARQGIDKLTPKKLQKVIEGLANEWEKAEKERYTKAPTAKDKGRTTLKVFIETVWIPVYVKDGTKSPNSVKFFESTAQPIIDYMGPKRMNQIDTELCVKFAAYLNTTAKKKNGEPYSQTSKMHIFGTLRNILRAARRWKYIRFDPTEDMTRNERPHREKKEVDYMTESEAKAFIDALQEEPLKKRVYFTLLLLTGMRRGEAVALQWSDINEGDNPSITVSKNAIVDKAQDNGRLIKGTKTGKTRVIPISETTLKMLKDLKAETENNIGAKVLPTAFVFCLDTDPYTCIFPSTPTRWMEGITKRHKLKTCSVHELRRTFATLALQAKVDPKTVASITGHADTSTLFEYYTGTDEEQQRKAVADLQAKITG